MQERERPRILIVEDVELMRQQFKRCLSDLADISLAERVDEVLEELLTGVDLIVLDIRLEGEKIYDQSRAGVEILRRVRRQRAPFRDIPVIVVTAHIEPEVEVQCRELNVVDFLRKPVDPDELFQTVKKTLEQVSGQNKRTKVFVSSTMRDLEAERQVAKQAIQDLSPQYLVEMAEDWHAHTGSPQSICQDAVRECDIFVLIVGNRGGDPVAPGGISPVEDEYNTARDHCKPILVFVKKVPEREPRMEAFLVRIGAYEHGHLLKYFDNLSVLRVEVQGALQAHSRNHS
jgi:CheY-like chemotaxis protein